MQFTLPTLYNTLIHQKPLSPHTVWDGDCIVTQRQRRRVREPEREGEKDAEVAGGCSCSAHEGRAWQVFFTDGLHTRCGDQSSEIPPPLWWAQLCSTLLKTIAPRVIYTSHMWPHADLSVQQGFGFGPFLPNQQFLSAVLDENPWP